MSARFRKSLELGMLAFCTASLGGGVGYVVYQRKVLGNRVKIELDDSDNELAQWLKFDPLGLRGTKPAEEKEGEMAKTLPPAATAAAASDDDGGGGGKN